MKRTPETGAVPQGKCTLKAKAVPWGWIGLVHLSYAAALTLAPWVRLGRPQGLPWLHWPIALTWPILAWLTQRRLRSLGYGTGALWPVVSLLIGLGLLTLYRLAPFYGLRQSLWALLGLLTLHGLMHIPALLSLLRRYRLIGLGGGLALTALTLIWGHHPLGSGPRLWLGCCGVYFQPSEPLKLIFLVYLAAHLADRGTSWRKIAPTVVVAAGAVGVLLAQHDLGTAAVFLGLYAAVVYAATGLRRWPALMVLLAGLAAGLGYVTSATLRMRVAAWLNPWADPGGVGYQPIQALMAVANGGLLGRGPGLGAPFFVPVAASDFFFVALVEELGVLGGWVVLGLLWAVSWLAFRVADRCSTAFGRNLAAGLGAYYGGQTLLIMGGNLRLLPLTGVTLPFLSYGGSSLLTAMVGVALLLHLERAAPLPLADTGRSRRWLPVDRPLRQAAQVLLGGFVAAGLALGYWGLLRSPRLLARTDNPRRGWEARFNPRGPILDRWGYLWAQTVGVRGVFRRVYALPYTGSVIGYANNAYGLAGIEAALDDRLRGATGTPWAVRAWHRLLYGTYPPGRAVTLTLDAHLEQIALTELGATPGAAVLLAAHSGEVLVLASTPTFNPNRLATIGPQLQTDPQAPLLNRATLGQYAPGATVAPWVVWTYLQAHPDLPPLPERLAVTWEGHPLTCALPPQEPHWATALRYGCPAPLTALGMRLDGTALLTSLETAGWFSAPDFLLPTVATAPPSGPPETHALALGQGGLSVSPIQMARAAAALTTGSLPVLRMTLGDGTPPQGATVYPEDPAPPFGDPAYRQRVLAPFTWPGTPFWGVVAQSINGEQRIAWFVGGTLPGIQPALSVAVALEDGRPEEALAAGLHLLKAASGQ